MDQIDNALLDLEIAINTSSDKSKEVDRVIKFLADKFNFQKRYEIYLTQLEMNGLEMLLEKLQMGFLDSIRLNEVVTIFPYEPEEDTDSNDDKD